VLEGVEVALGGAGAGSFAASRHERVPPFWLPVNGWVMDYRMGKGDHGGSPLPGGRGKRRPYAWVGAGASPAPTGVW
jgi:hypothetical protein